MGFYPENERVEYQGIGRAARQGQKGSSQIVFSKDEFFFENEIINCVKDAENIRNFKLIINSIAREKHSEEELKLYNVLKMFFNSLQKLKKLFNNEKFQLCFDNVSKAKNISYESFIKEIIEKYKMDWAEFFDGISSMEKLDLKSSNDFKRFLKLYKWDKLDVDKSKTWEKFIKDNINY